MPYPRKYASHSHKQKAYRQRCKVKRNATLPLEQSMSISQRTILSLCDFSGAWSKPYRDAGYNVVQVDLKLGHDVRLIEMPRYSVHGILAAPPCTDFAVSGARWWNDKGEQALLDSLAIVDACLRLVSVTQPKWWALENPVGRLKKYLGTPAFFQPCDYGDTYTKKTCLWGNFNPDLPWQRVIPVEGSKMWARYGGKSERTKAARSVTPQGFAMAFFLANP